MLLYRFHCAEASGAARLTMLLIITLKKGQVECISFNSAMPASRPSGWDASHDSTPLPKPNQPGCELI